MLVLYLSGKSKLSTFYCKLLTFYIIKCVKKINTCYNKNNNRRDIYMPDKKEEKKVETPEQKKEEIAKTYGIDLSQIQHIETYLHQAQLL